MKSPTPQLKTLIEIGLVGLVMTVGILLFAQLPRPVTTLFAAYPLPTTPTPQIELLTPTPAILSPALVPTNIATTAPYPLPSAPTRIESPRATATSRPVNTLQPQLTRIFTPPAMPTIVPPKPTPGTPPPTLTPLPLPLLTPISNQVGVLKLTNEIDLGNFFGRALWSPDGKQLLYVRDAGVLRSPDGAQVWSLQDLWVVNGDGTNPHRLIENASNPAWSKDGRSIYYTAFVPRDLQRGTNNLDIYVANADGSDKRLLSQGHAIAGLFRMQALPNDQLAYLKDRHHPAILDAKTQRITCELPAIVFRDAASPDNFLFSPDGSRLLYALSGQMWLANADGTDAKLLPIAQTVFPPEPWWSFDGQHFAFSDINRQIWIGSADGKSLVALTGTKQLPPITDEYGGIGTPYWSADNKVFFFSFTPNRDSNPSTYVIGASDRFPLLLAKDRVIKGISPDGQNIALSAFITGGGPRLTIAKITR